jgi:hypothetical protein
MPDYYRKVYEAVDSKTTRKPSDLSDVATEAFFPETQGVLFGRLPVLEVDDDADFCPMDDLSIKMGQRFMLNYRDETYYVNTEGYEYCRYMLRITEKSKVKFD